MIPDQQRLPSLLSPPIGFAHRGARAYAPENTLEAFRLAVRLGATGLESDVWLTRDGHAVLDHDGIVRIGVRKRAIGEVDRADLPDHIPTLDQLYEACGTALPLSLDVKDPEPIACATQILAAARRADAGSPGARSGSPGARSGSPGARSGSPGAHTGEAEAHLWLTHWHLETIIAFRDLSPVVRVVESTRLRLVREGPERRAAHLAQLGVDAVNLHYTDWTGGLVALFHRFGRYAFAWDLQQEHFLRKCIRMGIDGVFSDWVDRMVDVMALEA